MYWKQGLWRRTRGEEQNGGSHLLRDAEPAITEKVSSDNFS